MAKGGATADELLADMMDEAWVPEREEERRKRQRSESEDERKDAGDDELGMEDVELGDDGVLRLGGAFGLCEYRNVLRDCGGCCQ